ncbi:M48 family metallopeptidase [Chloroflexota bacterium]
MLQQPLDQQRQQKAREYARLTRRAFFAKLVLGAAFFFALLLSGLSVDLGGILGSSQPARVALYFTIVMFSYTILSAPLGFYRGFVLPHRYGVSHQGWRSWLVDETKKEVLSLVLGCGLVVVIYQFIDTFPQSWWLLSFSFMALLTVVLTNLAPVLILPLFFRLEPLAESDLRERLLRLAKNCQTKIKDVFLINLGSKTTAGNAAVMGLGNTRRIIISDTLLEHYTPDEIEVIMAHELGHHIHGDIMKFIGVQSALMLFGFYLAHLVLNWAAPKLGIAGISDVAALPVLVLVFVAFSLAMMPLTNAYMRNRENAADRYALAATDNPMVFANMLAKLTDQNLAESEPARWAELLFYDHSPYSKRVKQTQRYQREES